MLRFTRHGLWEIIIGTIVLLAIGWGLSLIWRPLGFLVLPVIVWLFAFFRDPERTGPRGANLIVAPADGKILMITNVDEPLFVHGKATRISIFMNIFNVHVNRYPVDGRVDFVHYNKGKFLNAAAEKSSLENEQMSVGIQTAGGCRVLVRQIAGLVARRIANYARLDGPAAQGERMGIIRFGSRVDVFVPLTARITVKVGDRPVAGTTVLAELVP